VIDLRDEELGVLDDRAEVHRTPWRVEVRLAEGGSLTNSQYNHVLPLVLTEGGTSFTLNHDNISVYQRMTGNPSPNLYSIAATWDMTHNGTAGLFVDVRGPVFEGAYEGRLVWTLIDAP